MEIKIVKKSISREELLSIAQEGFGDVVKAVVDVEQGIMAVGGEFHADEEVLLMEQEGSKREHTWGINLYPAERGDGFVEFDSMVNLKPSFGNRSRIVQDSQTQKNIRNIVERLVTR